MKKKRTPHSKNPLGFWKILLVAVLAFAFALLALFAIYSMLTTATPEIEEILNKQHNKTGQKPEEKAFVKVYFLKKIKCRIEEIRKQEPDCPDFEIKELKRIIPHEFPVEKRVSFAMRELLKGPSKYESQKGYYSEIPVATKLFGVEKKGDKIFVDISRDFEVGGGSFSMFTRLNQLSKTIVTAGKPMPVYLLIEGKQADAIGGEGIMVSQPLVVENPEK